MIRLDSSIRICPPTQTFDTASKYMGQLGISRVTQITRMDRLGLPVFASIRPRGMTLRVHAGKGMAEIDAKTGALMEAIEFAVAEPQATPWKMELPTIAELAGQLPGGLRFVDLIPKCGSPVYEHDIIPAVQCTDIVSGELAILPAQLVFLPLFKKPWPNLFGSTSNGLASGNNIHEATLHGLLEVLERDVISMNMPQDISHWVNPDSFPPPFLNLSRTWAKDGVVIAVRSIPNEYDLPCFHAILHEAGSTTINLAGGYGLHLDPGIALARAICEAAQSRLTHIHGGRDDITDFYTKYDSKNAAILEQMDETLIQQFTNTALRTDFPQIRAAAMHENLEQQLESLLSHLVKLGFTQVYRYVFDTQLSDLAVVKIIVPRCEYMNHTLKRVGPRLMQRILKK